MATRSSRSAARAGLADAEPDAVGPGPNGPGLPSDRRLPYTRPTTPAGSAGAVFPIAFHGGPAGAAGRPKSVYENKISDLQRLREPVRLLGPRPDVLRREGLRERAAALPRLPQRAQVAARERPGPGAQSRPPGLREMYDAVCAQCGTATTVPFRPRGDRPVYCRTCYTATNAVRA